MVLILQVVSPDLLIDRFRYKVLSKLWLIGQVQHCFMDLVGDPGVRLLRLQQKFLNDLVLLENCQ